ncbi:DsbA family protein [Candidatus Woesearchaeota archaeon]|nr:DsbA family protein [Candidatus Woesearchaeota archaeon]
MERRSNGSGVNTILLAGMVVLLVVIAYQMSVVNSGIAGLAAGLNTDVKKTAETDVAPTQPTAPEPTPSAPVDMEALFDDDAVKGDPEAPVTIVEWSDFECPFCARFYEQSYKTIVDEYVNTGKVKIIFRDFPLSFHPNAQKAAEAAECAGEQDKFYEMHDKLFESGVSGGVATFKKYAADIGLDQKAFDSCLDNGDMAAEVAADMSDGVAAGIKGTPGFIINGELVSGAQPIAVFKQVIDAKLAE